MDQQAKSHATSPSPADGAEDGCKYRRGRTKDPSGKGCHFPTDNGKSGPSLNRLTNPPTDQHDQKDSHRTENSGCEANESRASICHVKAPFKAAATPALLRDTSVRANIADQTVLSIA